MQASTRVIFRYFANRQKAVEQWPNSYPHKFTVSLTLPMYARPTPPTFTPRNGVVPREEYCVLWQAYHRPCAA